MKPAGDQHRGLWVWLQGGMLAASTALTTAAQAAASCSISVGQLAFGVYDTLATSPTDTAGSLLVSCTPGVSDPLTTSYTITVAGTGVASDAVRSISQGVHRLYFQVYKDAARSMVWGNGAGAGAGVAGSVSSPSALLTATRSHTAYARLPAAQRVAPGLYTGSLLVTIEY